jgi:hypothetical protein
MIITLFLLLANPVKAFEVGLAPFCSVDTLGNKQCYYYDMTSCQQASVYKPGITMCVLRVRR